MCAGTEFPVLCAGLLVADLFVPPLQRLPAAGELVDTGRFLIDSGGCAANTARCLARLGVAAAVAGTVGQDIFGDFVVRDMAAKGVRTDAIRRSERLGTSQTVILPVTGEDRRYIHTFGANADLRVEDIGLALTLGTRVLYVGGYLALPGLDPAALAELLREARARGVRNVLDVVVPAGVRSPDPAAYAAVLQYVDAFLPNDREAEAITGEREPARQAARLVQAGCGSAVVTCGARGAVLANAREIVAVPAWPVQTVDPSGAGDAFAAGFIVGMLEGGDAERCLALASAVGGSVCRCLGCTAGAFDRAETEAFLRAHPVGIQRMPLPGSRVPARPGGPRGRSGERACPRCR